VVEELIQVTPCLLKDITVINIVTVTPTSRTKDRKYSCDFREVNQPTFFCSFGTSIYFELSLCTADFGI
jgi:hypothetical protein